jgi:hypothetical protein
VPATISKMRRRSREAPRYLAEPFSGRDILGTKVEG